MASTMSGILASVAPWLVKTLPLTPCCSRKRLVVSGISVEMRTPSGRSATAVPRRLLGHREDHLDDRLAGPAAADLPEADDVGAGLGDPVAAADAEVEDALLDVGRDLLRAQEAHPVDARVVDARLVVAVAAADDGEVGGARTARGTASRGSPWAGRGRARGLSEGWFSGRCAVRSDRSTGGPQGCQHRLAALVLGAAGQAGAVERLLLGVGGEHAVADGVRSSSATRVRPGGHGVADVLEVRGATADDDAERDDGVVRAGQRLRDDGQLDGAGDPDHRRVVRRRTRARRAQRAVQQRRGDLLRATGRDDGQRQPGRVDGVLPGRPWPLTPARR